MRMRPQHASRFIRSVLFVAVVAVVASPAAAQGDDPPEWYLKPPARAGWTVTAGSGLTKIDALAAALGQLADDLAEDEFRRATTAAGDTLSAHDAVARVTVRRIGSIQVSTLTEKSTAAEDASKRSSALTFRRAVQLLSADSSSRIKSYVSSVQVEGEDEEITRSIELEGELQIFLDALAGLGGRITTQESATRYYLMVAVPERALMTR